jgi:hypothetical protein
MVEFRPFYTVTPRNTLMAIPIRKDMAAIPRLSTAISMKRLQKGRSRAIEL